MLLIRGTAAVDAELLADIMYSFDSEGLQERNELLKFTVRGVMEPALNMNSIVGLHHKILLDVINDNSLLKTASKP
jgi:hypothetical protein